MQTVLENVLMHSSLQAVYLRHGYCGHDLGVDGMSTIPCLNVPK